MALPPEAQSPSGLVLCPWLLGVSPKRFSYVALQGAVWVPSHHWVGTKGGNGRTSLGTAPSDSWDPGEVPALSGMPTDPPTPSHESEGIHGRSRAVAPRLQNGEGRCQAGQSHLRAKPGNGKLELLASPAQKIKGLGSSHPGPVCLIAWVPGGELSPWAVPKPELWVPLSWSPRRVSPQWTLCPATPESRLSSALLHPLLIPEVPLRGYP